MNLGPLTPYANLMKWGLIVALLLGTFVTGCNHGTGRQFAKDKDAIAAADKRANIQAQQAAILAGTLAQIDAETAEREAASKAEADKAKQAAARAEKAEKQLRSELATIERDIDKAKRDPECRQMLEAPTCAALH